MHKTPRSSNRAAQFSSFVRRIGRGSIAALLVGFTAGWASAAAPFATKINTGLVQAFSAVGQNLFGEAVFDAVAVPPNPTVPPNPVFPQGYVQMDVALDTQIPAVLGVFAPVDPCRKLVQLEVQNGAVTIAVDELTDPNIVTRDLTAFPPAVDRCTAPPVVDGAAQ